MSEHLHFLRLGLVASQKMRITTVVGEYQKQKFGGVKKKKNASLQCTSWILISHFTKRHQSVLLGMSSYIWKHIFQCLIFNSL